MRLPPLLSEHDRILRGLRDDIRAARRLLSGGRVRDARATLDETLERMELAIEEARPVAPDDAGRTDSIRIAMATRRRTCACADVLDVREQDGRLECACGAPIVPLRPGEALTERTT